MRWRVRQIGDGRTRDLLLVRGLHIRVITPPPVIIVGSRHRNDLTAVLTGSTARKVVHMG